MRLGVLISGRGSNLQALIKACAYPAYPAEIAVVVSNRSAAPGLAHAAAANLPSVVIADRDQQAFAAAADAQLRAAGVELVCLAGFMRLLANDFVETWRDRMINIHPSLLPAFPGLHAQRQALAAGVRFAGCTVHFVRPEVDTGPIIAQAVVPVHPEDDESRLSARILAAEHHLYPFAVRLVAEGRTRVVDNRVSVTGWRTPGATLLNPAPPDLLVSSGG
ncbi:MAG: phosphoribosylglycinamide formyltransferase [Stellaceae bacterium]